MEVVDDVRLLELAREPIRELLPTACRVSAMKPLVILLAFLPGLLVFRYPTLNEATASAGLQALKISAATSPLEWFVASVGDLSSDGPMLAPLVSVLMGLSLSSDLLTPESRLLLVSYSSSVFLLLSLFALASKLGGGRFAFAAVLLTCCQREFLELSCCLPPISLALAFALLSFRGIQSHQDDDDRWVSWPLIGSGFALGAGWLTGGSIALAAWFIICVQSFTAAAFDCSSRATCIPWQRVVRRRLIRLAHMLVAILIVTAIVGVLGCTWGVMAMGLRPTSLWQLVNRQLGAESAMLSQSWFASIRAANASRMFLDLSGALLGFVLLGIFNSARGIVQKKSEASCRRDRFVMVWFTVAWILWFASWPSHQGEFISSVPWSTLVLVPIILLAAQGLEEILGRRFGFGSVLFVTVITLAVNAAPSVSGRWHPSLTPEGITTALMGLLVISVAGVWLFRRLCSDDRRRRVAILLCVIAGVATNAAIGLWSLKPQSDDERELIAFRRQLSAEPIPAECWVICDEVPPARIRFFLQSLWKRRAVRWASDWDTMFVGVGDRVAASGPTDSGSFSRVVVTWGTQKWPAADLRQRGHALVQATDPHFFQRRLLKAYHWSERPESK
ncbi:MAG: hypothetical protein NT013_19885 [Planctomycetia bacterium]|nr:hypothetical protein [Planctomycetia bacterium]